eukprot:364100-Chlamydomonas_euryale.AAC.3
MHVCFQGVRVEGAKDWSKDCNTRPDIADYRYSTRHSGDRVCVFVYVFVFRNVQSMLRQPSPGSAHSYLNLQGTDKGKGKRPQRPQMSQKPERGIRSMKKGRRERKSEKKKGPGKVEQEGSYGRGRRQRGRGQQTTNWKRKEEKGRKTGRATSPAARAPPYTHTLTKRRPAARKELTETMGGNRVPRGPLHVHRRLKHGAAT